MPRLPLLQRLEPVSGTATRVEREPETGQLLFIRRQAMAPILEHNQALAGNFDRHAVRKNSAGVRHVASIPHVVVAQLMAAGIWSDQRRLLAWLSERENMAFRTDDGSRIG